MKVLVALLQVTALGLLVEMCQCQIMSRTLRQERSKTKPLELYKEKKEDHIEKEKPWAWDYYGDNDSMVKKLRYNGTNAQVHRELYHYRSLDDVVFNKHPPIGNAYKHSDLYVEGVHKDLYPLLKHDYPIHGHTAYKLKDETYADSPMTPDDLMLRGDELDKYCQWLDTPLYPSSDSRNPYWKALEHIVDIQYYRRRNVNPSKISTWPKHWKKFSLEDIAQAVKNEFPNSEQGIAIERLLNYGGGIQMDHSVMRRRSALDAVGTQFVIAAINTWVISAVSRITFLCKWYYGVPRPEEMAFLIAKGKYSVKDGVPYKLVKKIKYMRLKNAYDFTAFKDQGSPTHPSYPAMHSSGSTTSIWLPVVAKLSEEEFCELLRLDYGVANARSVAGVHYLKDNIAGLNLGMKVMHDMLPRYLVENFHANPRAIQRKLDRLKFDWNDFDPRTCTIAGVKVGKYLY